MRPFAIKKGDTAPPFAQTLREPSGVPVNLTGASVTFRMEPLTATAPTVAAPAVIVNPTGGAVEYRWASGDTAQPGRYWAELAVAFADGKRRTWPSDGYYWVRVFEDLA